MIKEIFTRKEAEIHADGKKGKMFEMIWWRGRGMGLLFVGTLETKAIRGVEQMAEDQAVDCFR